MAILSIEQIAQADDLPTKLVEVPEWGGEVKIRSLTKQQQADVRSKAIVDEMGTIDDTKLELGILIEAIMEPKLTYDHLNLLRSKNADVVDRILGEVFILNALDKGAIDRKVETFQDELAGVDGDAPREDVGDVATPDAGGADD